MFSMMNDRKPFVDDIRASDLSEQRIQRAQQYFSSKLKEHGGNLHDADTKLYLETKKTQLKKDLSNVPHVWGDIDAGLERLRHPDGVVEVAKAAPVMASSSAAASSYTPSFSILASSQTSQGIAAHQEQQPPSYAAATLSKAQEALMLVHARRQFSPQTLAMLKDAVEQGKDVIIGSDCR
jgi:hypothetical protein